jgi:hypothetical protein
VPAWRQSTQGKQEQNVSAAQGHISEWQGEVNQEDGTVPGISHYEHCIYDLPTSGSPKIIRSVDHNSILAAPAT